MQDPWKLEAATRRPQQLRGRGSAVRVTHIYSGLCNLALKGSRASMGPAAPWEPDALVTALHRVLPNLPHCEKPSCKQSLCRSSAYLEHGEQLEDAVLAAALMRAENPCIAWRPGAT